MSVSYANSWDAGRILSSMSPEERERFKLRLAEYKLLHAVLERPYNKKLCSFVEEKLVEEETNG